MQEIRKDNDRTCQPLLFTREVWVWNAKCDPCVLHTLRVTYSYIFCCWFSKCKLLQILKWLISKREEQRFSGHGERLQLWLLYL